MRSTLHSLLLVVLIVFPSFVAAQDTTIKPGDVILLSCEEEPTLNREYTVTSQGAILVDFLGAVYVKDKTELEAANTVRDRLLNERILREATVKVKIVGRKNDPVLFSGAVKVSGKKDFSPGMRLSDIVRAAQPTEAADLKRVVVKSSGGKSATFDFSSFDPATNENNPLLSPGDEVVFYAKRDPGIVVVLGGVVNPGGVTFESGLTLRKAIAKAGGFSSLAVPSRVRIERESKPSVYVDLTRNDVDSALMEGDRVFVETSEQRKYVMVMGAVKTGGFIELLQGLTLSKAVDSAGGLTSEAQAGRVLLTRNGSNKGVMYDLNKVRAGEVEDPVLAAGDKISVSSFKKRGNETMMVVSYIALLYILLGK